MSSVLFISTDTDRVMVYLPGHVFEDGLAYKFVDDIVAAVDLRAGIQDGTVPTRGRTF